MLVLVSYDIVNHRTRKRVMKRLKDYGERVQLSVFHCDVDEGRYTQMKEELAELIDAEVDAIRYYRVCRDCIKRMEISGWGEAYRDEGFELV
jgi:CRISPR-associated protein Cas2